MPQRVETVTTPQARRLLLAGQALLGPAPAGGVAGLIGQLGYVQMDSINVLERAHHLILGSRIRDYRPEQFEALLDGERQLFEHWTHDASAIPLAHYPHWKVRFPVNRERILGNAWWRQRVGDRAEQILGHVLARIRAEGPLRSADFEHERPAGGSAWWGWKPQKAALEFLWHSGELAVARRVNFHKVYDLAERVFPEAHARPQPDALAHRDWACASALERLGCATPRELATFWNLLEPAEATAWCAAALAEGRIRKGEISAEDGPARAAFALPDWRERVERLPPAEGMVILCPFDPILRDRARALRLFGFDYRFEAFVPEAKRLYGYYVLPILEGEALVGRLDPKFHRERGVLEVKALWWEHRIRSTRARMRSLERALEELAERIGAAAIEWG